MAKALFTVPGLLDSTSLVSSIIVLARVLAGPYTRWATWWAKFVEMPDTVDRIAVRLDMRTRWLSWLDR